MIEHRWPKQSWPSNALPSGSWTLRTLLGGGGMLWHHVRSPRATRELWRTRFHASLHLVCPSCKQNLTPSPSTSFVKIQFPYYVLKGRPLPPRHGNWQKVAFQLPMIVNETEVTTPKANFVDYCETASPLHEPSMKALGGEKKITWPRRFSTDINNFGDFVTER